MRGFLLSRLPVGHLRGRFLVHVHVNVPAQLLHEVPGLHAEGRLLEVLRQGRPSWVLLRNPVRCLRRKDGRLLPRRHLPGPGALRRQHLRVHMSAVPDAGFAGLGFVVGLAALWSP